MSPIARCAKWPRGCNTRCFGPGRWRPTGSAPAVSRAAISASSVPTSSSISACGALPSARGPGCARTRSLALPSARCICVPTRGDVRLKSADPLAPPAIRFNFLKTSHDLKALTAGMRLARKIVDQPALSGYVAGELIPGKDVNTDAEFEAAIRKNGISNLHPVGTCRMGADDASVLDPRLRVRGIERLRVIDASVMPS